MAAKAFYDACKHPSDAFYQLGDQMVDERGCPRSEAFGADEYLVFFGGLQYSLLLSTMRKAAKHQSHFHSLIHPILRGRTNKGTLSAKKLLVF